ncbi:MAG: hypothetical protein IJK05_08280 [Bacteroidales bacterium]|nr:hypothetical protein [Bacteroidales bacterium]
MRKIVLLLAAIVLFGCDRDSDSRKIYSADFVNTGCDKETRAGVEQDMSSTLILKYTSDGMEVTRSNALLNCAINNGGITCEVTVEDNVIHYSTYETSGELLKCLCLVRTMTSKVKNLSVGKEYVLDYSCGSGTKIKIPFKYTKDFYKVIDL